MRSFAIVMACATWFAACGQSERNKAAGAAAAAGASVEDNVGCASSNAQPIWGKPYDPELDCIDVDEPLDAVACQVNPADDDPNQYTGVGFACVERIADGKQYWVFSLHYLGFDTREWKRCTDEPPLAPKPCYAAGCPSAPRSSCTLEETRGWFNCSSTGEYDENCCGRQECSASDECSSDEECREVYDSAGQWYCWDYPGGCDCGGPRGGPPRRLCMPIE